MRITSKLPIYIHPFFWIFSGLIGFLMSGSLVGTLLWIVIIFVSVLVHELGHASMALIFKQNPKIELIAMGGLTTYQGKKLKYYQQFLIVLNGPLFGLLLCGVATLILYLNIFQNQTLVGFIRVVQIVNLFWTVINLLPVLPLDGGQLLRIVLEACFGIKGFKISLLIGFIIAAAIALGAFAIKYYLLGALFFLFAFQSFDMYRKSRNIQKCDRDDSLADDLSKAENALNTNNKEEAKNILESLRNKTQKGLIYTQATHILAFIYHEQKDDKKTYDYLLSIKDKLADDAIPLLHQLAFDEKNYQLVKELSAKAYKLMPSQEIALKNAKAFAALNEAKPSGGWLKTAKQFGALDIEKVLSENYFDKVKELSDFKHFFK